MTAHWEAQLDSISRRQGSYQQFMQTLSELLPELLGYFNFSAMRKLGLQTKENKKADLKKNE